MSRPSVAVVGGGILGMTAAYRLAQEGVHVALYERSNDLGGLVGSFDFDGHQVDRFYHVNLPSDDRILPLAEELGLGDKWRWRPTKVGFYDLGRLFSMTSPKEFLTFPVLRPHERIRLARVRRALPDDQGATTSSTTCSLLEWLRRLCGRRVDRKALGAAARLEVRRALRRPPGHVHLGADAPDVDARATAPAPR